MGFYDDLYFEYPGGKRPNGNERFPLVLPLASMDRVVLILHLRRFVFNFIIILLWDALFWFYLLHVNWMVPLLKSSRFQERN